MKFHPRLSNIQSKTYCRLKKLLESEWVEEIKINKSIEKAIDISDSELKLNNVSLEYLTLDNAIDINGKKYEISELFKSDLKNLNEFLDTFIFENEI